MSKVIPYGKQEVTEADIQAVTECLKGDYLTQGPKVAEFEKSFATFVGAKYALATNNATSALHLSALALNVKPGQKVICTPNTFVASSNAILYCGGDIEFIDIDPKNYCLDIHLVEQKLKSSPQGTYAGIVAVDFAGYPMNFKELKDLANRYDVWLIEDACHAPGAEFETDDGKWHKSGNGEFADIAVFSFHPVKHIATGEGGMITTNSKQLYEKMKLLRTHGITKDPAEMAQSNGPWWMEMKTLGMNYRIPDVLCALGLSQLSRIENNLKNRRQIALKYDRELAGLPIGLPEVSRKIKHAYHLYVIQTEKRSELYAFLKERSILTQVHYIPIYRQPYYIEKYGPKSLSKSDQYYAKALSLPMYHAMTEEEQNRVIKAIREFHG